MAAELTLMPPRATQGLARPPRGPWAEQMQNSLSVASAGSNVSWESALHHGELQSAKRSAWAAAGTAGGRRSAAARVRGTRSLHVVGGLPLVSRESRRARPRSLVRDDACCLVLASQPSGGQGSEGVGVWAVPTGDGHSTRHRWGHRRVMAYLLRSP